MKSRPAALYKALGGFATNGVNIVKLESYLSGARFEQAQFYAEVEGHPAQRGLELADALRHGGLRQVQLERRRVEAAEADDALERPQLAQSHVHDSPTLS